MSRSSSRSPLAILVVLGAVGVAVGFILMRRTPDSSSPTAQSVDSQPSTPLDPNTGTPGHGGSSSQSSADPVSHRGADPDAFTRDLIAGLTNLDLSTGRLSAEQSAQVRQNFQALVAQGAAAVPTIKALLDQKVDVNFGKGSGDSIGAPTLRTGLLESLRQIGGPEAIAASRQILQSSSNPLEIALVARNLEGAAPGQYRQDSMDAAVSGLNAAAQGQMGNTDVGPLFQALQAYGDTNALGTLTGMAPKYGYYASLALAGLPSGQGVPALTQMAQDASEAGIGNRQFALQMLAQASAQSPDAGTALVNLARQNQVPEGAWTAIAAVLAGQQFQFPRQYPENMFTTLDGPDLRTYRQQNGNQNFISTTLPTDGTAPDATQRLALIDQILASTTDPAAVQALQQAKARLGGGK